MSHIHELIDFTVVAYIVHKNKVLLVDHKKLQMWLPVGGHIELDENPETALLREIEEETGLGEDAVEVYGEKPTAQDESMRALQAPLYMDQHKISDTHEHIGLVYFVKAKHGNIKLAEREHAEIRWFAKEELADPQYKLTTWIRFCAEKALQKLAA